MLKIYGSKLCPDCVQCCRDLEEAGVPFEYCDFADDLRHLKAFLHLRDEEMVFNDPRAEGKIGIPCILRDDGTVTLEWAEFL